MACIRCVVCRLRLQGVHHIVWYGVPENAHLYAEIMNMLEVDSAASASPPICLSLFSKFDAMALERIVGTEKCASLLKAAKSTFVFS